MSRRKPEPDKSRTRQAVLPGLGAHLRRLRLDREMSQERLAELSGLNYKYIGKVELGKADPGAVVLVMLARGLSVPVAALFEFMTPSAHGSGSGGASRPPLAPGDVEAVTAALETLTTALSRLLASAGRPPRRTPSR